MARREYLGICEDGHRSYLRLDLINPDSEGVCQRCGKPAMLIPLPPPR